MASTAESTVPWAVMMMTGTSGLAAEISSRYGPVPTVSAKSNLPVPAPDPSGTSVQPPAQPPARPPPAEPQPGGKDRGAWYVGLGIFVSKIVGLVRSTVMARYL